MTSTLNKIANGVVRFSQDEEAASAVEYALIAALVGIAIVTGLKSLATGLNTTFSTVVSDLT